jgi:hypothetical protein
MTPVSVPPDPYLQLLRDHRQLKEEHRKLREAAQLMRDALIRCEHGPSIQQALEVRKFADVAIKAYTETLSEEDIRIQEMEKLK